MKPNRYAARRFTARIVSVAFAVAPVMLAQADAFAQFERVEYSAQAQVAYSQQELDQMLAPIALYPDALLSQILMAATYPSEVADAARWSRSNAGVQGERAVRAVDRMDWDPSVKSLVAFPQILATMDEHPGWTENLGNAFLAQESQVMDSVQQLRQKAYASGSLRSNEQVRVQPDGQVIYIEPANPQVVYVPYYDPTLVYGQWWSPAYPPVYWAPWPGYSARSSYSPGWIWGVGVGVPAGLFFGTFDWHRHRINVVHVNNYYTRNVIVNRPGSAPLAGWVDRSPQIWRHDPKYRRGIPSYPATWRRDGNSASAPTAANRDFQRPQSGTVTTSPGNGFALQSQSVNRGDRTLDT